MVVRNSTICVPNPEFPLLVLSYIYLKIELPSSVVSVYDHAILVNVLLRDMACHSKEESSFQPVSADGWKRDGFW